MRILLLTQFYPPIVGGEERHVKNLATKLLERGHQVNVATLWYPGASPFEIERGIGVHRMRGSMQRMAGIFKESERRHAPPFPDPEVVNALRRVVQQFKPDIVHAHNWLYSSFLPLKKWSAANLIVTLHDYGLICAKKNLMYKGAICEERGLTKCGQCASEHYGGIKGIVTTIGNFGSGYLARRVVDKFIAVSHAVARYNRLAETGVAFEVIHNFVPDNVGVLCPDLDPCLKELPNEPYILFVGDMNHLKGADILLKAYPLLDNPPPLVMIGRRSADLPAEFPPNVHLLGPWSHDAIMHAWSRCLFGVVPSVGPEPCATVVMEAMGSGKTIIVTDIGGMPELVDDGSTGIIIKPDNVNALVRAMQGLLVDRERIVTLGTAALADIERLKASAIVTQIERVYRTVRYGALHGEAA